MFKVKELNEKIADVQKEKNNESKKRAELTNIKKGDRALHSTSLNYTDPTTKEVESFTLLYEVEVLEVAESKIKVKGIDFTSNDKFPRIAGNKATLITYITGKWIDKKEAQILIDGKQASRDEKLEKLFSKVEK